MKVAANTAKVLRNVPLPDEVAVTHTNAAVLDMGSHSTRLGFAGDSAPRMHERTATIRQSGGNLSPGADRSNNGDRDEPDLASLCFGSAHERYLGDRLTDGQQRCTVMDRGNVADWEAWEQLIERIDSIMLSSRTELNTPLLLTEKALVPVAQRQKMAEVLYEKHRLNAVSFALSPVLALYASGLCTGVSVELGHEQSHVVPVFQGFSLFHATHCLDLGGNDLTALLANTTAARLPDGATSPRGVRDIWAHLKERHCAAAGSRQAYTQLAAGREALVRHQLPDGSVLELAGERFAAAEAYFDPTLVPRLREPARQGAVSDEVQLRTTSDGKPPPGLHSLIEQSVRKCDEDLVPALLDAIVLSGGSSLFRGLPERLEAEVQALLPGSSADRARVIADVERREAAFVGGSILASLPTFQDLWVTKAEYDEVGPMAVVRGCF